LQFKYEGVVTCTDIITNATVTGCSEYISKKGRNSKQGHAHMHIVISLKITDLGVIEASIINAPGKRPRSRHM
jgi:small nuclear ribonucleoprotein (snRNP)-like protein